LNIIVCVKERKKERALHDYWNRIIIREFSFVFDICDFESIFSRQVRHASKTALELWQILTVNYGIRIEIDLVIHSAVKEDVSLL